MSDGREAYTTHHKLRLYDEHGQSVEERLPREFADSAAALAAGLKEGDVFRTGEELKIVVVV